MGSCVCGSNRPGWDDDVRLALEEIRLAGAQQVQIGRRLRVLLDDLMSIAPDHRQPALRHQLARLTADTDDNEGHSRLSAGCPKATTLQRSRSIRSRG